MIFQDAQSALPFVLAQGRNIEAQIYTQRYPSFDYASVLPVVVEGDAWAIGTQFMTMDMAGEAKFLSGGANDMPFNQVTHGTASHDFAMIGSGWEWNLEEVNQASLYRRNLNADKAVSALRSIERLLYDIAMSGSTEKGWKGFVNQTGVTIINAPGDGTGSSTFIKDKTPAQVLRDLNNLLMVVSRNSNEIEYADTVAMPPSVVDFLASTYVGTEASSPTILARFLESNVYTAATGRPLTVKRVRDLATAAADGSGRIVAYRNERDVLRMHLPMPRQFLDTRQKSIMGFETGIIARTGGVEVRLPGAMAYLDKVSPAP